MKVKLARFGRVLWGTGDIAIVLTGWTSVLILPPLGIWVMLKAEKDSPKRDLLAICFIVVFLHIPHIFFVMLFSPKLSWIRENFILWLGLVLGTFLIETVLIVTQERRQVFKDKSTCSVSIK